MRAGLLADIILGESPHLKGLARHFNLLVLNPSGKITGYNHHFLFHSGKTEKGILHHHFPKVFDSDEGKAELALAVRNAAKGQPGSVSFQFPESKIRFTGVILPVYDDGIAPTSLMVISKAEAVPNLEEREMDSFWELATQMMEEVGILPADSIPVEKMKNPKILLIEDKKGLIAKLFQGLLKKFKNDVVLAPSGEAARLMCTEFKPNVVISTYEPIGNESIKELAADLNKDWGSSILYVSTSGSEIRIEDGWLDIHVKNQAESVSKILDLIQQLYW